ncbi:response regulator transcription factor [Advenella sp. RU8]|uniref:response regulator transcription factor n=1 Tax=Advenella sp. RU8 TaxID=3399575 RepID=UPI003AAEE56C
MKFLLADDHALIRCGLISLIQQMHADWQIHEAEDLPSIEKLLQTVPDMDLLMLDVQLPGVEGLSGLREIRRQWPELSVIMISSSEEPGLIRQCLSFGASGFIPKSTSNDVLGSALNLVLSGGVYVPPAVLYGLGENKKPAVTGQLSELSSRQLELLSMIAQGYSNQEIAVQKNLAVQTVKNQASAIFKLLNARNRIEAISIYRSINRHNDHLM